MAKGDKLNKNLKEGEKLISMSAENAKKLNDELKGSAGAVQGLINVLMGISDELEGSKKKLGYFEDGMENSKSLAKGLTEGLGKMADKLDKSKTISGLLKGNFEKIGKLSNLASLGSAAMAATLIKGIIELDKIQTQYNKNFGLTDEQAKKVQKRMGDIALASGRTSITFLEINKAIQGISNSTGILASSMRNDVLEEAAELQKLIGLSDGGMAALALNAQTTGQHMEDQSRSMVEGVLAAEEMLGVNLDVNKAFKTAAGTTGLIRANLGRSFEEITRVTAKAQAFGLTLQDLAGVSSNLLNFQSSIEAELTAELFIGKQLNLEKARLYALTGDYSKLQDEIVGQLGNEFEFLQMNTLQKQKFAAALGMEANQLSDLIFKRGDLNALMEEAERRGATDLLNQLKQQDLATQFKDIMTKIQMTFIDIAGGPIGDIASMLSSLSKSSFALWGILSMIGALKFMGLITSMAMMGRRMKLLALNAGIAKALMNPVAALASLAAVGIVAGVVGSALSKNESESNKIPVKSQQGLEREEMVTVHKGGALMHAGESVVRTDNFKIMTNTLKQINESINNQKLDFTVETHHATRYR